MFFKKKQEQSAEPAVVSAESSAERKLPLILRWPISIILLFVMPPFGTAVGIGLAVARLIFNHKYPKYKLKLWTKLIIFGTLHCVRNMGCCHSAREQHDHISRGSTNRTG